VTATIVDNDDNFAGTVSAPHQLISQPTYVCEREGLLYQIRVKVAYLIEMFQNKKLLVELVVQIKKMISSKQLILLLRRLDDVINKLF